MNHDDALDEVGTLATLEHFFIVECLSVQCALGHDLEAGEGGATDPRGRDAADGLASYAQNVLMNRFRRLNLALVDAGRDARLDRAEAVSSSSHPEIVLEPPSAAELQRLVEREHEIAVRIDERYATLAAALGGDPLQQVVEDGADHVRAADALRDAIGGATPADILRATRRDPADSFEQRLLDLSDRAYRAVVAVLRDQFVQNSTVSQTAAVDVMDTLNDANRVLVQRGLLPPFSPA